MPTFTKKDGTELNKGFCNIELTNEEQAQTLITKLNGYDLEGRILKVDLLRLNLGRKQKYGNKIRRNKNKYGVHISNINFNSTKEDWIEYLKLGEDSTEGFWLELPINRSNPDRNLGWCNVYFKREDQVNKVIED